MTAIDSNILDSLGISQQPSAKKDSLGQGEFLKLMTTQLNNQDPTKPMDSGEFFTQIAQFSSVAGIHELQNSFKQVANAMYSSQALQASAMVGRSVMVPADNAELKNGGTITGSADLPSATPSLMVGVFDSSGQLVRRMDMGHQPEGIVTFSWDGVMSNGEVAPAGRYYVKAESAVDGGTLSLNTYIATKVDSVTLGKNGEGISLNLAGVGKKDLSEVKQIM